jgi:hypothetical protein
MRIAPEVSLASRVLVWTAAIAAIILLHSSSATAQQVSRYEVSGEYAYQRFDGPTIGFGNYPNLNGWKMDGAFNLGQNFSVVADIGGDYGSKLSSYAYMIGPRYSFRKEKSRFFGQFLFGKAQNTVSIPQPTRSGFESVGRVFSGGGGYERDISSRFTFRVIQVDYLRSNTFGTAQNNFRVSTGLVIHLGRTTKRPRL